jgi:DNA-directed RNA polymerase subunit F
MKLTNEEFHLLTQYWVSRRVFFRDETLNQPVDKLIEIAKEHINDKLEMAKKSLSFADKIKDMDINNMSEKDILSLLDSERGRFEEDNITTIAEVIQDTTERIKEYEENPRLLYFKSLRDLLEKINSR